MKEIKKESSTRRTNGCFYLLSVQVDEYSEYEASMLTKVQVYTLWCYGRIFLLKVYCCCCVALFWYRVWLVLMFVHWYNVHVYTSLYKLIKQDSAVLFNNIVRHALHTYIMVYGGYVLQLKKMLNCSDCCKREIREKIIGNKMFCIVWLELAIKCCLLMIVKLLCLKVWNIKKTCRMLPIIQ